MWRVESVAVAAAAAADLADLVESKEEWEYRVFEVAVDLA
jgi:hypothetical protein